MATLPLVVCSMASVCMPQDYARVLFTGIWGAAVFLGDIAYRLAKGELQFYNRDTSNSRWKTISFGRRS